MWKIKLSDDTEMLEIWSWDKECLWALIHLGAFDLTRNQVERLRAGDTIGYRLTETKVTDA